MIRINLLPHREEKRKQRRRDFYVMAGVAFVAALFLVGLVALIITTEIGQQTSRNEYIKQENAKLDDQIKEIADLRQEIDGLKARQQAVEDLQSDRNLPVHLLDELVKQVPEGIYLQSLRQEGLKVTVTGVAQSNDRVSELLRNLGNNSVWLQSPELIEIHAVNLLGKRLNQFTITVSLRRPTNDKDARPGGAPKPAANAAGNQ